MLFGCTLIEDYNIPKKMLASLVDVIRNNWKKDQPKNKQDQKIVEKVLTSVGKCVQKTYIKKKLIGKGAFAQCYVTQNVQNKRKYATKIIVKEDRNRNKLLNQLLIHQLFHHDNIVDFSHAFEDDQNIYVFMELCQNDTLEHLIYNKRLVNTKQIQSLFLQIIQGLIYIHSKNVIHRDLKPRNIFLDQNNQIKIGDFGLAVKLQFDEQRKRSICGTPQYMAPEMIEGRGYGKQSDIWSLGILLYQMFTGRTPFVDINNDKIMDNICNVDYLYIQKGIPKEALSLIKRILIKNPQLRPSLKQILQSSFFGYQENETILILQSPRKLSGFNLNFQSPRITKMSHSTPFSLFNSTHLGKDDNNHVVFQFITQIQQINNDIVVYLMSNMSVGVLKKDAQVLVENVKMTHIILEKEGKIVVKDNLDNLDHFLKTTLEFYKKKCKKYAKTNELQRILNPKQLVYLTKYTTHRNILILKLSNQIIQIRFTDKTSFLINLNKIDEINYIDQQKKVTEVKIEDVIDQNKQGQKQIEIQKIVFVKKFIKSVVYKSTKDTNDGKAKIISQQQINIFHRTK